MNSTLEPFLQTLEQAFRVTSAQLRSSTITTTSLSQKTNTPHTPIPIVCDPCITRVPFIFPNPDIPPTVFPENTLTRYDLVSLMKSFRCEHGVGFPLEDIAKRLDDIANWILLNQEISARTYVHLELFGVDDTVDGTIASFAYEAPLKCQTCFSFGSLIEQPHHTSELKTAVVHSLNSLLFSMPQETTECTVVPVWCDHEVPSLGSVVTWNVYTRGSTMEYNSHEFGGGGAMPPNAMYIVGAPVSNTGFLGPYGKYRLRLGPILDPARLCITYISSEDVVTMLGWPSTLKIVILEAVDALRPHHADLQRVFHLLGRRRIVRPKYDPTPDDELLKRAKTAVAHEQYELAASLYSQLILINADTSLYFSRAAVFSKLQKYDEAINDAREVINRDKRHYPAIRLWALCLEAQKKWREALDVWKQGWITKPGNKETESHMDICIRHVHPSESGDLPLTAAKAKERKGKSLELEKKTAKELFNLMESNKKNDFAIQEAAPSWKDDAELWDSEQPALQILQQRHEKHPSAVLGEMHVYVGCLYAMFHHNVEARRHVEQGFDIIVTHLGRNHEKVAATYTNLGAVYGQLKNLPKKFECYHAALDIYVRKYGNDHLETAAAHDRLGVVYFAVGNNARAKEHVSEALKVYDKYAHPHRFRLRLLMFSLAEDHNQFVLSELDGGRDAHHDQ